LQSDENNIDDEALKNRNGTMEKRVKFNYFLITYLIFINIFNILSIEKLLSISSRSNVQSLC